MSTSTHTTAAEPAAKYSGLTLTKIQSLLEGCRPTTLAALVADMINSSFDDPDAEDFGDLASAALVALTNPTTATALLERERIATVGA